MGTTWTTDENGRTVQTKPVKPVWCHRPNYIEAAPFDDNNGHNNVVIKAYI